MTQHEFPFISVEDYLHLDDNSKDARFEYLDGELRMLAGGSVAHSLIAMNIAGILYNHLRGKPCRVYNSDIRLQLSESRYVYPDITVSCDQRDQQLRENTIRYPRMIIEILSPSTEAVDRMKKFVYYRECPTVQEYVMIDSQKVGIDMYRREEDGWTFHTLQLQNTLHLKSLNIQIPVKDIYEAIDFSLQP